MSEAKTKAKPFSWSYSRLKNFEACPRRHHEIDVLKSFKEEASDQLAWGDEVHKAAENYFAKKTPLPLGMPVLQHWLDKINEVTYDKILVEQKLAINNSFEACGYFDKDTWFRTKADFLGIRGPVALGIDWKTGKLLEDSVQLALMAACIFAALPSIKRVRTEFVWLKEGRGVSTREDFSREGMINIWRHIWPRIETLQKAYETGVFPAKPNSLCRRWCPVKTCEHHGR